MEFASKKLYLNKAYTLAANGVVGVAADLGDISQFAVTPTAQSLVLTLPTPPDARSGLSMHVANMDTGAISFEMYGATVRPGQYAEFLWSGTQWLADAHQQSFNVGEVVASGRVNIGDIIPAGARAVTNGFNIANATGLDGSLTDARLQVVFTSALPTTDYVINGHLTSLTSANWNNDNDSVWIVVDKLTTGFTIATRELASVTQNLSFDFQVVQRRAVGQNVPTWAQSYVGPATGQLATVQLDGLIMRYDATTNNIQAAVTSGTLAVNSYNEAVYGGGAMINTTNTPATLTTTFQTFGDPGLILAEHRTYLITPTLATDARAWYFEAAFWTTAKTMIRLQRW